MSELVRTSDYESRNLRTHFPNHCTKNPKQENQ